MLVEYGNSAQMSRHWQTTWMIAAPGNMQLTVGAVCDADALCDW